MSWRRRRGSESVYRSYGELSPLKKRYEEKSVCVSGMETAFTLRRKRMGTWGSSCTACAWEVPNWVKFAWLSSPQLWFGKISVDGFQLLVHGAVSKKAISWGCKTTHKELPKGPVPLAGNRMEKAGRCWWHQCSSMPCVSLQAAQGRAGECLGQPPWELLLSGLGAASCTKTGSL